MTVIQMTPKKPVFKNEKNKKELIHIVDCQIKYTQFKADTMESILRGVTSWFVNQNRHYTQHLKTLPAVFEIYDIVTVGYDELSIETVMQGIKKGELEPTKWNQFVIDRNLTPIWPVYKRVTQDGVTTVTIM